MEPEARPALMDLRQSRKRTWALRNDWKEDVRCSSSESSCFLSWLSCGTERDIRSTAGSEKAPYDQL